jgi:hypothetical protein
MARMVRPTQTGSIRTAVVFSVLVVSALVAVGRPAAAAETGTATFNPSALLALQAFSVDVEAQGCLADAAGSVRVVNDTAQGSTVLVVEPFVADGSGLGAVGIDGLAAKSGTVTVAIDCDGDDSTPEVPISTRVVSSPPGFELTVDDASFPVGESFQRQLRGGGCPDGQIFWAFGAIDDGSVRASAAYGDLEVDASGTWEITVYGFADPAYPYGSVDTFAGATCVTAGGSQLYPALSLTAVVGDVEAGSPPADPPVATPRFTG